ncbi:MAG: PaaI family thioesterase [Myxococcota bacterium]|nr:PaaI family thioesterase [Myxococcota bacterium]
MTDDIRNWIETSPYSRFLGVKVEALDPAGARLVMPYQDENSNPGQVLHGGCAASLGAIAGQAIARANLGDEGAPYHNAQLQVNYLAAAKAEEVVIDAKLLRKGRELCFVEVDIATREGKAIAKVTSTVRGRMGKPEHASYTSAGDDGQSDPGSMGPHIGQIPFIGNRGISVEHMTGGTSRLTMPPIEGNLDEAGHMHEGAVLALLDTAGAMASWAKSGVGPFKASTASMQIQNLAPAPATDLVAYGRNIDNDDEIYWTDVEVASASDGRVYARGCVLYRIVK